MLVKTLNFTQDAATQDQVEVGVLDLPLDLSQRVKDLLTFHAVPSVEEIRQRAQTLATLARDVQTILANQASKDAAPYYRGEDVGMEPPPSAYMADFRQVMVGGAPFFMGSLCAALKEYGLEPVFAFSTRESVYEVHPGGSVRKTTVFRHSGWVPAI